MKTYLDCIPCFFKQALLAARSATDDERAIKRILDRVGLLVPDIPLTATPPETARLLYRIVREETGVFDPLKRIKEESTRKALALYPSLKAEIEEAEDPLQQAVRIAIAGNVIDFGANPDLDLDSAVRAVLLRNFGIHHHKAFKEKLDQAETVLYLADNAGETVFDRLLIETMGRPVTYVVREKPIINDATKEDALAAGLQEWAEVISSGCDAPGTILPQCSEEFRERFHSADLIISKGQGNFETLSEEKGPLFFLFMAKCPIIATHAGVEMGTLNLMEAQAS